MASSAKRKCDGFWQVVCVYEVQNGVKDCYCGTERTMEAIALTIKVRLLKYDLRKYIMVKGRGEIENL